MERSSKNKLAAGECLLVHSKEVARQFERTKPEQKSEKNTNMVIFGSDTSEENESECKYSREIVGPVWGGGAVISGLYSGNLDGVLAYMPMRRDKCSEVSRTTESLPMSINLRVHKTKEIAENFETLEAADRDVELYLFPNSPRSKEQYNKLVEYMIANSLAMTYDIGEDNLTICCSIDLLPPEQWTINGKHYLWGTFRRESLGKKLPLKLIKQNLVESPPAHSSGKIDTQRKGKRKSSESIALKFGLGDLQIPKRARSKRPKATYLSGAVNLKFGTKKGAKDYEGAKDETSLDQGRTIDHLHTDVVKLTAELLLQQPTQRSLESKNLAFQDSLGPAGESSELMSIPDPLSEVASNSYNKENNVNTTKVGLYKIKPDLQPILFRILEKYGDIACGCTIEAPPLLEYICQEIQALGSVPFECLCSHHLCRLREALRIAEVARIDVTLLVEQCMHLEKAALKISESPDKLKTALVESITDVQSMEETLRLQSATTEMQCFRSKSVTDAFFMKLR